MNVPFNKPVYLTQHLEVLKESLEQGQLAGNGPFTRQCEQLLEKQIGRRVRIVTSATHAIEMMGLLLDLKPGDEVILPSFTFVSTANPFALRGARLRFADNDEYGNILPTEVERLYSKKTRAVLAVDYAGGSADFDRIHEFCRPRSVAVFEDAAQAIGATYRGRPLGTIGDLGAYSFHDTKNLTSGEGGCLIFGDEKYLERAEIIREKGTNRSQFLQGLVDKYTWVAVGSSYVLSEMNAAYLLPQLERIDEINGRRKTLWMRYSNELSGLLAKADIQPLGTPSYNKQNYHMFAVVFPKSELRNKFIKDMKAEGITCPFHYVPLHSSPFGSTFYEGGKPDHLAGCDRLGFNLVRLPLYYNMTDAEQSYVLDKISGWLR